MTEYKLPEPDVPASMLIEGHEGLLGMLYTANTLRTEIAAAEKRGAEEAMRNQLNIREYALKQQQRIAELEAAAHGAAQAKRVPLTKDDVRNAGGIVHSDGNIFFTNLEQLNVAHSIIVK